ncbi:ABC multidrug transporter [Cadophora sp. MPI-SDFR-AT-0126]|nr:ABC multidrug transporter [Leotiomycetes sp. MPI-SDFR-AT-0126]
MASELSVLCESRDGTFGPHAGECRGGFDFTLMFEEIVLTIFPLAFILICAPFRTFFLLKKRTKVNRRREASYAAYEVISLCLIVNWAAPGATKTRASIPTAVLTLITFLILPILSYAEHTKSVRPSLLLNTYFLLSILFDVARTRTLWLRSQDKNASNFTAALALKVVILILEGVGKRRILKLEYQWYPTEATSGIYNTTLFWWLNELLRQGSRQTLSLEDLFVLDKHLISKQLQSLLEGTWMTGVRDPHTLFWTTSRALKWPLLSAVIPRLGLTAFNFCQPFLLQRAIRLSQQPVTAASTNIGYGLIGAYFLVYTGIAVTTGQFQHLTYRVITMIRGGLISLLYGKATELSITAADPSSSMILMSADIERITTGWQTVHELWANVIEVGLAIYLLERQLGAACAVPIAVAIVSMAGSLVATSLVMSRQAMWLEAIERRIAAATEMLGSMKGVKMCGLTDVLSNSLQDLRRDELRISKRFRKLLIWNMGFTYITPICAPILTFTVYSVIARNKENGATLDTAKIFTSLSLFTLLSDPLQSLIMSMATFAGSIGSFQRIQDFLSVPGRVDKRKLDSYFNSPRQSDASTEIIAAIPDMVDDIENEKPMCQTPTDDVRLSSGDGILVVDAAFGWQTDKPAILKDITFRIPQESMSLIMGPVGCGKSTLLKGILGEVTTLTGSVYISSSDVAFCDQTPWHMNGTIQQSILGVSKMEEIWYSTVTQACALDEDFSQLSRGDQTLIGSKGISLSGGQSQRIALARAIYARKSIVVLDDVFGGLDVDTENRVFHNLFGRSGILRKHNTTTMITSSSAKRLPYSDHIIILSSGGQVAEQGNFKELSVSGGYVSSFELPPPDWNYEPPRLVKGILKKQLTESPLPSSQLQSSPEKSNRQTGDVAVYLYYVKAVGWIPTLIFIIAISAFVFCMSFPTIWIKWWAASNVEAPNQNLGYYLGIYALLGVLALLFLVGSCWQLVITMVPRSGESFHKMLLETVLSAPMSFFNSTDTGITVNRFSQDLMLIDMELPLTALNTVATFILCIAQMVLIGVASTYSAISFPIVLVALYFIQKFYLRTSRQLRLLDLEAKSPLYSQFMECLSGLATVRAFGWQHALEEKHRALLDQSQKPFYLLFAIQRWLTLVLDLVVAAIAVVLITLVVKLRGIMDPGFVGVALLNVILFSQSIKMLLTFWTNLETHIGSVSRVKSFTRDTEKENLPNERALPPPDWPASGTIEFKNVSAGYKTGEPVLKHITLSIECGEKIGVCGRTGSGKTSFVLSIFRMIEMSGGSITIDDLDISTLPRQEVRSKIIGVPQDAYLLIGSVRLNADPHSLATDTAIVDALKTVQLWEKVKDMGGLDTDIEKVHLSHGQKQLFCLARAMLRKSTILILDEATSSVDSKTDELMQRIIRERFSSHTIIAVAHKLDTILDFDKVLLLDEGELVEYDSPYELLSDESSAFHKLYYSSHAEEEELDDRITLSD